MGIFKRILGICDTGLPADAGCWSMDGGRLTIDLGRTPELAAPGGAIRLEGGPLTAKKRLLVVRTEDGFACYLNRCTHAGRRLDPTAGGGVRCCSVNGSRFDGAGQPLAGPGKKPLTTRPISRDGERLIIE